MKIIICPCCHGDGSFLEESMHGYSLYQDCGYCKGSGKVSLMTFIRYKLPKLDYFLNSLGLYESWE